MKKGPVSGPKTGSWEITLLPALTAVLFGVSYLCFQHQWFLVMESFFLVSFMALLAASDLRWRLLPHPLTNFFILLGLLFKNNFSFSLPGFFSAAGDCLLMGSLLFAAGQMFHQGLGGGDIKMASGLAVWLGLSRCFLVLLAAFVTASFFVLPALLKGKANLKTAIPLGPYMAAFALLIWFCPKCIDLTGMGL